MNLHAKWPWTAMLGLAGTTALLVAAGCGGSERRVQMETAPAEPTTLEVVLEESGVVESTRVVTINSPFRGRIVQLVDSGTEVSEGDVLALLDVQNLEEDLEEQIENLKSIRNELEAAVEDMTRTLRSNALDISSAQAELDMTRVELANVNQELSELEYLQSRDLVAEDNVRSAAFRLRTSEISTYREDMNLRERVTGSQSTELNNQTRLERISLRASDTLRRIGETAQRIELAEIRAPADGMFLRHSRWDWSSRRNVERQSGEEVREGDRLGEIPDVNHLVVRSQIPESEMLNVQTGTPVELSFEAAGNLQGRGTVQSIGSVAVPRETSAGGQITATGEELTGEKVFEIVIAMEDSSDERLRSGLSARVRFVLDQREGVLTVPLEAINATPDGDYFVQVINGRERETRAVSLGQSNDRRVEVLEGLAAGDQVVIGAERRG